MDPLNQCPPPGGTYTMSHRHHQASLEGILDSSPAPALSETQRHHAHRRFYQIIGHFDTDDQIAQTRNSKSYNRPRLVRLTYEYALSQESRDLFLRAFFRSVQLQINDEEDLVVEHIAQRIQPDVFGFAECLMEDIFLPRALFHLRKRR